MKDLKACFGQHQNTHTLFGVGLGLLLVGLISGLAANALVLGVVVGVAALAYDYFFIK